MAIHFRNASQPEPSLTLPISHDNFEDGSRHASSEISQERSKPQSMMPKSFNQKVHPKSMGQVKSPRERSGVMKSLETVDDQTLEQAIRPKTLADYIGQSALKKSLQISLKACQNRSETLEHTLLYGPPGLGKTTLAMVLAHEMNAQIHITSAPALERPRDVVGLLMSLQAGDMLFIDEIHRLNKVAEEILYPAMEDFALDRTIGKGHATKILRVPLPKFTLVGATTKAGSLSSPLRDRFGLVHRLNHYLPEELHQIIQRSARLLNIEVTDSGARIMAQRARGTPRIVNRLLRRVRDFVEVENHQNRLPLPYCIDEPAAEAALDLFEIDPLGLDHTDRRLLMTVIEKFSGGPVGLDTLATAIGEDSRTIEDVYEPYLVQSGLLHRTPRGRMITPQALIHLKLGGHAAKLGLQMPLSLDTMESST